VQVKSFVAPSMPEALDLVREALGSEAVLLRTRMIADHEGRKVEITAALDHGSTREGDDDSNIDRQAWGEVTGELESARDRIAMLEHGDSVTRWLHEADFLPSIMAELASPSTTITKSQEEIEADIIAGVRVGEGLLPLPDETRRIALVGPSGVGKTTALVKLAAQAASV
jgi:flagellar biosynthesis GTPase FlhF